MRVTSDSQPSVDSDPNARRIVVGVDGSEHAMRALAWAAHEARLRTATLELVHAGFFRPEILELFDPQTVQGESAILDRSVARAKELEPSVRVTARVCEPPAAEALIAASDGAEMLVVGSRGLTGFRELTMGSVSSECAHHARCTVVIIRPEVKRDAGTQAHSRPN
jgi:nucleotide-binding universal stress UspA family protein